MHRKALLSPGEAKPLCEQVSYSVGKCRDLLEGYCRLCELGTILCLQISTDRFDAPQIPTQLVGMVCSVRVIQRYLSPAAAACRAPLSRPATDTDW